MITRKYFYHIPNGGSRHPLEGRELKLQGVKPGVSDNHLAYPSRGYHGFYLELKRQWIKGKPKPKATAEQIEWILDVRLVGSWADVFYGWEEAWESMMVYLSDKGSFPLKIEVV